MSDEVKAGAVPGAERALARLTIPAEEVNLSAILNLVRDVAARQGLDGRAVERLSFVLEEACANVIESAYSPGEAGTIDVVVARQPGKLLVALEDQGLPFDFRAFEKEEQSSLAELLARAFPGEIRCINLGRRGNRVEFLHDLPAQAGLQHVAEEEIARAATATPADASEPLTPRLMDPAEVEGLIRCLYRSYGYTYPADFMYDPNRVAELLRHGLMISCVAANRAGEIVGHLGLTLDRPDAQVAESGQAIVDPRYRGHQLFEHIKTFLKEHARERGMFGFYSEAVAVHPYSQKGNLALGARETGVLLGYSPAGVAFKKIETARPQRQSVVLFYLKVNESPVREHYLPAAHADVIRRVYERAGLARTLLPAPAVAPAAGPARVDVKVRADANHAFLQVRAAGEDLEAVVAFRLRELRVRPVDCVYLDLPMGDAAVMAAAPRLEGTGFFFGGVIPEVAEGDVLRLQYLNNVAIHPEQVHTASDFGKELLEYVLRARAAAQAVP